jgi:hypothetical protein
MLAPSLAQAQNYQPCCQDTLKLFWHGADAWRQGPAWQPYKPVAWQPYTGPQPCCQDTAKLFWRGIDAWTGWQQPVAAKGGKKRRG